MAISGIGYEGMSLEAFISRLRLRSVDLLIDVRLNAISRKRGFSKKSLASALEDAGIEYRHFPHLGNERDNRDGYGELTSGSAVEARRRYRAVLADDAAAQYLRDLADLSKTRQVEVFCFEKDQRHCHREQVIEAVNELLERDSARR